MKKLLAICIIGLSVGTASLFADHPDGWGVGIVAGGGYSIGGIGGGGNFGLSLKIPSIPVFWGLKLGIGSGYFGFGVTGDYYIFDKPLVPDFKLHWYLGVGGYFDFQHWSYEGYNWDTSWSYFNLGVRVPIGLSWQPLDFLEIFLGLVPQLGVNISTDGTYEYDPGYGQPKITRTYYEGGVGFGFGFGAELGIRFWF